MRPNSESGFAVLAVAAVALAGLLAMFGPPAGAADEPDRQAPASEDQHHQGTGEQGQHMHGHPGAAGHAGTGGHVHAATPAEYRGAHVPASVWTNAWMLARGKEVYIARCAVCHGERGDGQGPAAAALPVKPPDLRAQDMVAGMRGNYWFWRVSEGGAVEPFKSLGSGMPAWKDVLPIEDRWAVIAYEHSFSGHAGPHVTSEHPEMAAGSH
jgi:mono/diheme cytochrome c family protein